MSRLKKWLIGVLGGLAALCVILLMGVNLYVQSEPIQSKISGELSMLLGQPVEVGRTGYTPWGGFGIQGLSSPDGEGLMSVEIDQVKVHPRLWPLLFGEVRLREVRVDRPRLAWRQRPTGGWHLPEPPPGPEEATEVVDPMTTDGPEVRDAEEQPLPVAEPRGKPARLELIRIEDGTFSFATFEGEPRGYFENVDMRGVLDENQDLRGDVGIGRAEVSAVVLEKIVTPVSYQGDQLHLGRGTANWAGGSVDFLFRMDNADAAQPFECGMKVAEIQLGELLAQGGGEYVRGTGRIKGNVDLHGSLSDVKTLAGKGGIVLEDGEVEHLGFLSALGKLLRIEELSRTRFREAYVDFEVLDEKVEVDRLWLESENFYVQMKGICTLEGRLDLVGRLGVSEKLQGKLRRLPGSFEENFHVDPEREGYRVVSFVVDGTVDNPRSNLMDQIMGGGLEESLQDLFRGFMGR